MPSFDIYVELPKHEVSNAVDQANREVSTRFDFKGVEANYIFSAAVIRLQAETEFQLQQMREILRNKFVKREIDLKHMQVGTPVLQHKAATQEITLLEGIDQDTAKRLVKLIKEKHKKVQASIQGDQVRVTGKKRDDLQQVMTDLKEAKVEVPLQFGNFRD